MVVTGDKAPSPIVNLPEPPVAIVITSDPEKVIDVFVSPLNLAVMTLRL